MTANITQFKVFLASPSDMGSDREIVSTTVDETNRLLADRAVQFRILRWERDVVPGVAVNHSQDVIGNQLLRDFDFMIALFGSRLGTPTQNAPSGTVEEVRTALNWIDSPLEAVRD